MVVLVGGDDAIGFRADSLVIVGVVMEKDASWHVHRSYPSSRPPQEFTTALRREIPWIGNSIALEFAQRHKYHLKSHTNLFLYGFRVRITSMALEFV